MFCTHCHIQTVQYVQDCFAPLLWYTTPWECPPYCLMPPGVRSVTSRGMCGTCTGLWFLLDRITWELPVRRRCYVCVVLYACAT